MIWYEPSSSVNPYWAAKYNLNSDTRDRFILNASLEYQFFDWLSAKFQAGSDIYNTDTESRLYAGSPIRDNGQYGDRKSTRLNSSHVSISYAAFCLSKERC